MVAEGEPARLYLDVEYSKAENPDKDSEEMMAVLKQSIEGMVESVLKVLPGPWVEMDSTTATKFSRHLLLPEVHWGRGL